MPGSGRRSLRYRRNFRRAATHSSPMILGRLFWLQDRRSPRQPCALRRSMHIAENHPHAPGLGAWFYEWGQVRPRGPVSHERLSGCRPNSSSWGAAGSLLSTPPRHRRSGFLPSKVILYQRLIHYMRKLKKISNNFKNIFEKINPIPSPWTTLCRPILSLPTKSTKTETSPPSFDEGLVVFTDIRH